MFYQIFNPDGSFLLDQMGAAQEYRGQLWQSGDHVIEVINVATGNRIVGALSNGTFVRNLGAAPAGAGS